MDFLYLMLMYCLVFIVGSLCLLYRDAAILCTGPIGMVRQLMNEAVMKLIPSTIQNMLFRLCNHLLYKRTCVFQVFFIAMCLLGHVEWVVDMLPILYSKYPNHNHTFWPFVAVFANYYCLHRAWTDDPGEVTNRNCDVYTKVYEYDDILYERGIKCSTCDVTKPARSKHCSVCNRCVHKFDHHCIWTNNCVGGLNHRFFILFMVTLVAMFLQGIYVGSGCLLDYAEEIKLFNASFIDYDNSIKPMTISVAFQHMFMQLPRLMFLVVGLSVLTVLVLVFLCHHLYLIACNQTTNERYKVQALQTHYARLAYDNDAKNHQNDKSGPGQKTRRKGPKNSTADQKILTQIRDNRYAPYSRGLVSNFLEVFLPHRFIDSKLKGR